MGPSQRHSQSRVTRRPKVIPTSIQPMKQASFGNIFARRSDLKRQSIKERTFSKNSRSLKLRRKHWKIYSGAPAHEEYPRFGLSWTKPSMPSHNPALFATKP